MTNSNFLSMDLQTYLFASDTAFYLLPLISGITRCMHQKPAFNVLLKEHPRVADNTQVTVGSHAQVAHDSKPSKRPSFRMYNLHV